MFSRFPLFLAIFATHFQLTNTTFLNKYENIGNTKNDKIEKTPKNIDKTAKKEGQIENTWDSPSFPPPLAMLFAFFFCWLLSIFPVFHIFLNSFQETICRTAGKNSEGPSCSADCFLKRIQKIREKSENLEKSKKKTE